MLKSEYLMRRRQEAKAQGICTHCLKNPVVPGMGSCAECQAKRRERYQVREDRKKVKEEQKERKKPKESVDDVAVKARRAGMSYGKYQAWINGQLRRTESDGKE